MAGLWPASLHCPLHLTSPSCLWLWVGTIRSLASCLSDIFLIKLDVQAEMRPILLIFFSFTPGMALLLFVPLSNCIHFVYLRIFHLILLATLSL